MKKPVSLSGHGLHSGRESTVTLKPAPPGHGIVFERTDEGGALIPAHFKYVVSTERATTLGLGNCRVQTVEHLMAALYAMGVTNLVAQVMGPEVPILDGSSRPFVEAILEAGIHFQPFTQRVLRVIRPIKIYQGGVVCEALPRESLRLTTSIDFDHPQIGAQTCALELTPERFALEIAPARTFGFIEDLDRLKANNLALGASLDNVLAFDSERILNPDGARFEDECVRHKLLDALGDLSLMGAWIEGEMVSFRGGHGMHLALLGAIDSHTKHLDVSAAEPLDHPVQGLPPNSYLQV